MPTLQEALDREAMSVTDNAKRAQDQMRRRVLPDPRNRHRFLPNGGAWKDKNYS
jgi:hypothetical protein